MASDFLPACSIHACAVPGRATRAMQRHHRTFMIRLKAGAYPPFCAPHPVQLGPPHRHSDEPQVLITPGQSTQLNRDSRPKLLTWRKREVDLGTCSINFTFTQLDLQVLSPTFLKHIYIYILLSRMKRKRGCDPNQHCHEIRLCYETLA